MIIRCSICGRKVRVKPSSIKDVNNYHCTKSECRSEYMRGLYGNPETKPVWDWTAQRKIVAAGKILRGEKEESIVR